jgi:hypothetical protein
MPATTGVSAVPMGRPGGELQVGPVPGFYLSSSAHVAPEGTPIMQGSLMVEPDRWLGVPGLVLGARVFGEGGDTPLEPYIGYRRSVDDGLSLGAGLFGTHASSTRQLATYSATRAGGEAALDARIFESEWFALHLQGAVAGTYIDASGEYCVDGNGIAMDCDVGEPAKNTMIDGEQSGVYPSATGTIALAFAKGRDGLFDGARIALMFATGTMPMVQNGMKTDSEAYASAGLTLTLGIAD